MFIEQTEYSLVSAQAYDVVIVGAGPAGITLALELDKAGRKVLLVEAGGFNFPNAAENDPYVGESSPRPYPVAGSRLRFFGGTSGHWGGWCRPLDPEDFAEYASRPLSGWPLQYSELQSYFDPATDYCETSGKDFDIDHLGDALKGQILKFDKQSAFRTSIFRFSPPTRFGTRYRPEVSQAQNIHCITKTSLLQIVRTAASNRTELKFKTNLGAHFSVTAKFHVLAMGGIENARNIVHANSLLERPLGGSGDWAGRCFMDHFACSESNTIFTSVGLNYNKTTLETQSFMARICLTPAQLAKGSSNLMISLNPISNPNGMPRGYLNNPGLFSNTQTAGMSYGMLAVTSNAPNRASKITLLDAKDSNGIPRVSLDWRISDQDIDNIKASLTLLTRELSQSGQARAQEVAVSRLADTAPASSGMHHIGTTRMAKTPAYGVTDSDCKVFDTDDLYIAGSSLFPTGGYANPTLTLVALSLRLADHLNQRLANA